MDTRLTFRDRRNSSKAGGRSVEVLVRNGFNPGPSESRNGKPAGSSARKILVGELGTRTTNRHMWTRRIFSGARVMGCSGTRQISSVTSGKGVPHFGEAAVNSVRRLFNKNTGLC